MQTVSEMQKLQTEESRIEEKSRRSVGKNKETTRKTPWNLNENSNRKDQATKLPERIRRSTGAIRGHLTYTGRAYRVIVTVSATPEYFFFFKPTSSSIFTKSSNGKNLC